MIYHSILFLVVFLLLCVFFLFLIRIDYLFDTFVILHLWFWYDFLDVFQHWRKLCIDFGLWQLFTFLDKCPHFWGKDIALDGVSKAFMAEKLFSWVELIRYRVILLDDFSFWSLVAQINLTFEEVLLAFSLEFYKDQSSDRIDHITVDFELWRENSLYSWNRVRSLWFLEMSVVCGDIIRIRRPKNFYLFQILRTDRDIQIFSRGEEPKIEGLEDILADITFIDCAKIVKPFYVLKLLADTWAELCRNAHNCQVDSILSWRLFDEILLTFQAIISHISHHNDPVLTIYALILLHKFLQQLFGELETASDGGSSMSLNSIDLSVDIVWKILLQCRSKDGLSLMIEGC